MRDNDRGDCRQRKMLLLNCESGTGRETQTKVRIVCEEHEAWVLGDLTALEIALRPVSTSIRKAANNPDTIMYPSQMHRKHYESNSRVTASADIAPCMSPETNLSHSFQAFQDAVKSLTVRGGVRPRTGRTLIVRSSFHRKVAFRATTIPKITGVSCPQA